jgi:hypothetical protein
LSPVSSKRLPRRRPTHALPGLVGRRLGAGLTQAELAASMSSQGPRRTFTRFRQQPKGLRQQFRPRRDRRRRRWQRRPSSAIRRNRRRSRRKIKAAGLFRPRSGRYWDGSTLASNHRHHDLHAKARQRDGAPAGQRHRANETQSLDVDDLDLPNKRAHGRSKGGCDRVSVLADRGGTPAPAAPCWPDHWPGVLDRSQTDAAGRGGRRARMRTVGLHRTGCKRERRCPTHNVQ